MKLNIVSTTLLTLIFISFYPSYGNEPLKTAKNEDRPNVLFILVDDLGWTDVGFNGSDFYETPTIDGLANDGVRFTQAYAASGVCSPTRASIMSGKHPARLNCTDYFGAPQPDNIESHAVFTDPEHPLFSNGQHRKLLPAVYNEKLDLEEVTIAEELKKAGYKTFFAGKWHLGPRGFWPTDQGFDVNKGGYTSGGPWTGNHYFSPYEMPTLENGPEGELLTYRLARETNTFIDNNKSNPFFAFLSFYAVHTPLMTTASLEKKYEQKKEAFQRTTKWGDETGHKLRLNQTHAVYAGMIETMDRALGMIIDKLKALGLYENTIIFLMSDNGGLATSEGWPTSNLPLRAGKGWLYEGGIREPMIVRWPGNTVEGNIIQEPVISHDFYPTILEMLQLQPTMDKEIDGVSFVPLIKNKDRKERPLYWHYPHYSNQGSEPASAIRYGDWKLIYWYETHQMELYNIAEDIGETKNLINQHPGKAEKLKKMLNNWLDEVDAQKPTKNLKYNYVE